MDINSSENSLNTKRFLPFILVGVLLVGIVIVLFLLSRARGNDPQPLPSDNFNVVSTSPPNGAQNIYPGEISITFDTTIPISSSDYTIRISPKPEFESVLNTKFPTQHVSYGIVGGLLQNTTYSVSVYNTKGEHVFSWSFKTSNETPESSSRQVLIEQENAIKNYYPLFYDVPFEDQNYKIDYTDRLTLEVLYTGDLNTVRGEVEAWIRSKEVDPSSHTINFVEN